MKFLFRSDVLDCIRKLDPIPVLIDSATMCELHTRELDLVTSFVEQREFNHDEGLIVENLK